MASNAADHIRNQVQELTVQLDLLYSELAAEYQRLQNKTEIAARVRELNAKLRELSAKGHAIQFSVDWEMGPQPEYFDHFMDQYHFWAQNRNPLWLERGIFGLLAIRQGAEMLEICCGDGFNAKHFYSIRCKNILAVDFDPHVIEHARRNNQAPNIQFGTCDIRSALPQGMFDNIAWDGAIEHFTENETQQILAGIKQRLKPGGVLTGYTIQEAGDGKSLSHHEYEFKSKEDLARVFTAHFANVKVFETVYPTRHNLYFQCSDGRLPFDADWPNVVAIRRNQ